MSKIEAYGIHWDYQRVVDDHGCIYGWKPNSAYWTNVPEAPEIQIDNQSCVYLLQTNDREIVYVGQVGRREKRLRSRLWEHTRNNNRERWTHFSWFGLNAPSPAGEKFVQNDKGPGIAVETTSEQAVNEPDKERSLVLNELEAMLIAVIEPRLNKRGGDWGKQDTSPKEFLQWSYHEDTVLSELHSQNRKLKKRLKRIEKILEK